MRNLDAKSNVNIYLNMKMKSTRREKNMATLSIVLNMTNSCRRKLGMNRTSFSMRRSRNVLNTDSPELPARSFSFPILWVNSNALF